LDACQPDVVWRTSSRVRVPSGSSRYWRCAPSGSWRWSDESVSGSANTEDARLSAIRSNALRVNFLAITPKTPGNQKPQVRSRQVFRAWRYRQERMLGGAPLPYSNMSLVHVL